MRAALLRMGPGEGEGVREYLHTKVEKALDRAKSEAKSNNSTKWGGGGGGGPRAFSVVVLLCNIVHNRARNK